MKKECLLIIISYNQLDYTKACVDSILKNTRYPYQMLIIDNGSNQETIDYLEGLEKQEKILVILNKENQGWIDGVNQGLNYGEYAYYCVMNNDILVYDRWLTEMVKVANQNEHIGLVNPEWEVPKKYGKDYERFMAEQITPNRGSSVETDWVRGFCFLIKRAVVEKIGGLDKVYGAGYYDDWDYSVRAARSGYQCARAKGAFVFHCKNITFSDFMKGLEYNVNFSRNKALFYNRWGRPLRVLVIYSEDIVPQKNVIKSFMHRLLIKQDNIFCVRTVADPMILHTNCVQKIVHPSFLQWSIWGRLLNNLRHSIGKRYNLILCSQTVKQKIEKFPQLTNRFNVKTFDKISNGKLWEEINSIRRYR